MRKNMLKRQKVPLGNLENSQSVNKSHFFGFATIIASVV